MLSKFSTNQTTFTLVGCHLIHDEENNEIRLQQFQEILGSLDSDYSFIAGDLNFRLTFPRNTVLDLIAQNDFEQLLTSDQLKNAVRENSTILYDQVIANEISLIQEAPISFPPTYKYNEGSDVYDTSQKKRTPSYPDRVVFLFSSSVRPPISEKYIRIESKLSDHRPVYSVLQF